MLDQLGYNLVLDLENPGATLVKFKCCRSATYPTKRRNPDNGANIPS